MKKAFISIIHGFVKYREYVLYAAAARLRSEVSNSYLNWIWWILEPMLGMFVYLVVFGFFLKIGEMYYPLFLYIGIIMWNFFSKSVSGSVGLVRRNRSIVTNIYIPKTILLFKDILVNLFKMLLSFIIVIVMIICYRVEVGASIAFVLPVLLTMFIFTFAISCFTLNLGVYYEDMEYVVAILLNAMMYFTGVFYSFDRLLPGTYGHILGTANPMAFFIISMRNALIYNGNISTEWLVIWLVLSTGLLFCGAGIIRRNENNYVKLR